MVTTQNLISKGYFPLELPPPFSTGALATLLTTIPNIEQSNSNQSYSKCCRHSIPKVGKVRRLLGIPNPLHQIRLCKRIETNWNVIEQFVNQSTLSLTTPEVRNLSERALSRKYDLDVIAEKRITEATGARFLLRTDISRYYGTIYTHSIPWAIHTKAVAKVNRGQNYYGNVLDTAIRNTQDQQTIGIPIGSDTSLLIGEIIGTAIDNIICSKIETISGFRYLDDYYLYFDTITKAEEALAILDEALSEYELEINPEKTKIISLPESVQPEWKLALSQFKFSENASRQKNDLLNYFSIAFNYAQKYPDDFVLKYSLGRFKNQIVQSDCWSVFESLLLNSIIAEPSVIPFVTRIFLTYLQQGYQLDRDKIKNTLCVVIEYHSKLSQGYEVAWALWLCRSLHISLPNSIGRRVSNIQDPIAVLVALDLRNLGLIELNTSMWRFAVNASSELYDEHWILAYEAKMLGWLRSNNNHIVNDAFFSILASNNVSFYDRSNQLELIDLFSDEESDEEFYY